MLRACETGMGLVLSKTGADAKPGKFTKFLNIAFPALNMYTMAQDYADGRSVGGILGDQAGFMLGNTLVSGALSKVKLPAKGIISCLGGMGAGLVLSPVLGDFMNKRMPIYRKKTTLKPSESINNEVLKMQTPPQMTG